ncbi:UNVERIFIED_CONTAM: hypothetical protein Sindi_1665600 [Sesamum indicum]
MGNLTASLRGPGLRQGDPLSPYLFVLVMEVLQLGFLQLIDQDELFSSHWKCDAARIFQLGFADDLLLFCRADMNSIGVFKTGLDRFAKWSGLRLNVQKSHLIISRSAQGLREEMLEVLGFQEGVLPMRYLGLPLLSSRLTVADCNPLLLKIDKCIAGWEGMDLSYAVYIGPSAFILPKKVTNEIEKRLRTFLWKGTTNSGYAKVAWKGLCRPKDEGGLGIQRYCYLESHINDQETLVDYETPPFGRLGRMEAHGVGGKFYVYGLSSALWWTIRSAMGELFYLWQDPWHYLEPLSVTFPRGPRLLRIEESARLSTVISEGEWQWPPITNFECLEITHGLPTIHGGEDRIIWRFDQDKPTTQPQYRLFDPPGPKVGWASLLSGSLKIPRHLFILWLAILGKLATMDKSWLAHLGPSIRRMVRYSWPNRDWITDIEWASQKWRGKHIVNISYRAPLASCVYHIWRERNLRRFEHIKRTPSTMALLIVEDIKQRILSISLPRSVSTRALYRL